ncbi:MAG TPA: hypothetical protein VG454_12695 [Gemmatimonadales bacterium]|nr:hypothetical protein [Gemmatimonadales bacterium]
MRLLPRSVWRLAAGTVALAAFAACSDSTSPSSTLTQAEANNVAEVVTTDAAQLPAGATFSSSTGTPFASSPMPGAASAASCTPTKTPASPTNSDADPVPDSVHVDFAGCTFTNTTYTASLSGAIDFVDPTPTVTDRALRTRYTDFTRSITNTATNQTRSVKENGTRTIAGSPNALQFADTMQTDYTFAGGGTAVHVRKWAASFTADQAGSIQMGSPLPSGTLTINGSSTYTSATNNYSLSVSTSTPLHYNASCTVEPRFDAGTLMASVTKNGTTSNVTIQFTACGQYTVTRS